jgi:hypothetical protein
VEGHVKLAPGANALAVHRDVIPPGIDFRAELADDFTVHGDAAGQDDLFAGTA